MSSPVQEFIGMKEERLERLVRGGLLKRKDAYSILCGFADTVRWGVRFLKNDKSIFGNITPTGMLILSIAAYSSLL